MANLQTYRGNMLTKAEIIANLQQELEASREDAKNMRVKFLEEERLGRQIKTQLAEKEGQFKDLKRRLHESETENARLRGYVQRVQEDDVVREDLVATGDPNGHQRLVPKRRHSLPYDQATPDDMYHNMGLGREKPKHWIEY